MPDDFGKAAVGGGDYRDVVGAGFEGDTREGIGPDGRNDADVHLGKKSLAGT